MTDSLRSKIKTQVPTILYSSYLTSNDPSSASILKTKNDYVNRICSFSPFSATKLKETASSQVELKSTISKYESRLRKMAEDHALQKQRLETSVKDMKGQMIPMMNILLKNSSMLEEYRKNRQNWTVSTDRDICAEYSRLKLTLQKDSKIVGYKFVTMKSIPNQNINPEILDKLKKLSIVNTLTIKVMPAQKENLLYFKEKSSLPKSGSLEKNKPPMPFVHQKVHKTSQSYEISPATLHVFQKRINKLEDQLREEITTKQLQSKLIEQLNQKIICNELQSLNSRWKMSHSSFYYC